MGLLTPPSGRLQLEQQVRVGGDRPEVLGHDPLEGVDVGPQGPQGEVGPQGPPGQGQVLSVETGAGLTGGPITTTGTISIADGGVTNAMLQNSGVTITAGAGLSGGGPVELGGGVTLSAADLGGDVSGAPGAAVVTALQGNPVAAGTPAEGQTLVWSASANAWVPRAPGTFRWAVADLYDLNSGWMSGNDAALYGGVAPSAWAVGAGLASQMSADKDVLRAFFTRRASARTNALVASDTFFYQSSAQARIAAALFRIRNTTAAAVEWKPQVRLTAYPGGSYASVALNGTLVWSSGGNYYFPGGSPLGFSLMIPEGRTSTAIFVSNSAAPAGNMRSTVLAFVNNALAMPAGLELVDDLDTAAGGWEQ